MTDATTRPDTTRPDTSRPDLAATPTAALPEGFDDALLALLNDEISVDPSQTIELTTDLLLTGLVDSLGVVQVVSWLEDELSVDVDPIDVTLENFQTPDRMLAFARSLVAGGS